MEESKLIEISCVSIFKDYLQKFSNDSSQQWKQQSIYKLPAYYMAQNKKAYQPQVVSFGPYHNGEDHLLPMEEHKHRALAYFLNRSKKPLEYIVESLREVVQELRESYHPLDSAWQDEERFLELMILDGCFMLEILYSALYIGNDDPLVEGYALNDPVFSRHGAIYIMSNIRRDMMILENQLPMLLLYKLYGLAQNEDQENLDIESLNNLIQGVWFPHTHALKLGICSHVLDVIRKSQIIKDKGKKKLRKQRRNGYDAKNIMRSATELTEAGVQFTRARTRRFTGISFAKGYLSLPLIVVDDSIESNLLNMIAFERFHTGAGNEVTSYAFFMSKIIDNAKDISLLHDRGIVYNTLMDDKAAAELFKSVSKDITLVDPENELVNVLEDVNEYCNKFMNQWRAHLYRNYFTNPCTTASFFAAILLFALTILQTLYTIYPYYNPVPRI